MTMEWATSGQFLLARPDYPATPALCAWTSAQ